MFGLLLPPKFMPSLPSPVGDLAGHAIATVLDFADENPRMTLVAGVAICGGFAAVFAGPIAACAGAQGLLGATSNGVIIATLEGAALESASLAALGGGSIAAGGFGMFGGTIVVASAGGGCGGFAACGLFYLARSSRDASPPNGALGEVDAASYVH